MIVTTEPTVRIADDGYNFPRSDWMCWECVRTFTALGSYGDERCPACDKPMEHLFGLLLGKKEE